MKEIDIEFNCGRVANLLKTIANSFCEEGEKWYEDIGEMPTMFDLYRAIKVLEAEEVGKIKVVDDTGQIDCPWR